MHKLFAEWYRTVIIEPDGDMLAKRWSGIEQLCGEDIDNKIDGLIRLYYGLQIIDTQFQGQVQDIFQQQDAAFRMRDNELELATLAGAALVQLSEDKKSGNTAILGMLAASCCGLCEPIGPAEIIEDIRSQYEANTLQRFQENNQSVKHSTINLSAVMNEIEKHCTAGQLPQAGPAIKKAFESLASHVNSSNQSHTRAYRKVVSIQSRLEEECNVLWWCFGQQSRDFVKPFSKIHRGSRSIVAGKELAHLVSIPGPSAAVSFLSRCLNLKSADTAKPDIELLQCVLKLPKDWRESVRDEVCQDNATGLCPVVTAILKSTETGDTHALKSLFNSSCKVSEVIKLNAEDLAIQAFLEFMYLKSYD
ncbi:MAG: GTPase-associated system all-helical protein GASH [Pseudomonadota bacterium]